MSRELVSLLNEYDSIACEVAVDYLEKHNLYALRDRVILYQADFDVIRPLRDVWIKLLDMDSLKFVEFYEDVYSFRKVPHYEDILITALISLISGLAANIIHDTLKSNPKLKKELKKFLKHAEELFNYLIKIYAVRNAYYFGKITYQKFMELKNFLKKKVFKRDIEKENYENKQLSEEFNRLWNQFVQERSLSSQISEELKRLIVKYIQQLKSGANIYSYKKHEFRPKNVYIIKGLGASPGETWGIVKVINSLDDLHKISEGDIGVFRYFPPNFVPALRRCRGAIGFPECGGLTGHLAIVCRRSGIPCVIYVEYEFSDGQVVYLNGDKGEI